MNGPETAVQAHPGPPQRGSTQSDVLQAPQAHRRVVVVVQPLTVPDLPAFQAALTGRLLEQGWAEPHWCLTTPNDPGTTMTERALAERALADGVDLVVCCGGDGTVRAVAAALTGTGVPLAVLPTGTGNLLARNLGVPLDLPGAVQVALHGRDQAVDVGVADGRPFLVMAGIGIDAAMVRDAPPALKSRLGWPAYVLSAARHLRDRPMALTWRADDGPWRTTRARGLLVGNVGQLQGGVHLLPAADPADGRLDVAVLAPGTLADWARVAGRVLSGGRRQDARLHRLQVKRLELRTRRPVAHDLDGDVQPPVQCLTVRVEPGALLVRLPR